MPQVDLISDSTGTPCDGKNDLDSPAESFWLSKDAEFDWFHRNAFYERKDSTKGMAANFTSLNHSVNNSTKSRRLSTPVKSKASIIELPVTQHCLAPEKRRNCRLGNAHRFPKQSGSVGKCGRGPSPIEPSSPKVSCMGRVRSKKDPERRRRKSRGELDRRRKSGFLSSFQLLFWSGCRECQATAVHLPTTEPTSRKRTAELKASGTGQRLQPRKVRDRSKDSIPMSSSVDGEPPSLCRMMQFPSSRRSDLWREWLNTA